MWKLVCHVGEEQRATLITGVGGEVEKRRGLIQLEWKCAQRGCILSREDNISITNLR